MTRVHAQSAPKIPNADSVSATTSRRNLLIGSLAAMAAAAGAPRAVAQELALPSYAAADRAAADLHAAYAIAPAMSAAVARPDGLVWAAALGTANVEQDVPVTPEHRFKLASTSKAVTASLAARLAARGVVDLDAPIATWMPDLPSQHRATTLRQLLNHQGGVRHYSQADNDPMGDPVDLRVYPSNVDILAIFIEDPLIAEPGTGVNYSTYGYTLASIVLETAAGVPFLDLVQQEIAAPRGLATLTDDDPVSLRPMRVSGYMSANQYRRYFPGVADGIANARQTNPAYKWAGGGLIASPVDLARFGASHLNPVLVTGPERETLFTPRTPPDGEDPRLGLGWRIDADEKGRTRWHHAGNVEGGRCSLVVYPELGLSVAFALNFGDIMRDVLTPSGAFADAFA